jgi:endonuclease/exonuclease/phosphatase family metal-dependent hydrolase
MEKERKESKKRPLWKKIVKGVFGLIGAVLALAIVLVVVLTVTEYKPDEEEALEVQGSGSETMQVGDDLTVLTWNIGYGCLGETADFFMDGGSGVKTADKELTLENMEGINAEISAIDPDIAMFQEVDVSAFRSNWVDEADSIVQSMGNVSNTFAYNYRSLFIPYPIPPIGTVNAGILTTSKVDFTESTRLQLPNPFTWPYRVGNLKRCLSVNRIDLADTDKELVIVNLHLEAYDSGEGKAQQTAMLLEVLQEEVDAGNYVIAAGDFNQIFSNVESDFPINEGMWEPGVINVSDFGDDFNLLMDSDVPSCRSLDQPYAGADQDTFQYYIIDGYIVSNNIEVNSVETQDLGFVNSDHNPVVLKARLK